LGSERDRVPDLPLLPPTGRQGERATVSGGQAMSSASRPALQRCVMMAALATLSACAFTPVHVTLPDAVPTGLAGGDGREVVVVVPFRDDRPDRGRCGMQKNGAGSDTAPALCSEDPAAWLARLLAPEARSAGAAVAEAPTRPGAVRVGGALLQFFAEPTPGSSSLAIETDVHVKLTATSASGLVAERSLFVKGEASGLAANDTNFQTSVDDAARRVVRQMVAAVLSLLHRYPTLG